jgi:hypothetical protein
MRSTGQRMPKRLHKINSWGSTSARLGDADLLVMRKAFVDFPLCRKLLNQVLVVGASGFEPPTSWSRRR